VLDAGEWKMGLGRRREEDGTEKLVGTSPWPGWPSVLRKESGGKVTLEMRSGQREVVFERTTK
jgi:hypothetical protein